MMRPLDNSKQVTTERPCAGNAKCLGSGLLIHLVRVRYLDLNNTLYGLARDKSLGCGKPALRRRRMSASAKARSESPPNHNFSLFSRSRHRTGSESMMSRHDLETREARAMQLKGRKLRTWDTSSGGRRVRKSRARMGVRTEWTVRRTGNWECRRRVMRRWDCNWFGRPEKWVTRDGRDMRVAREASG
jgi:hypothetical protein